MKFLAIIQARMGSTRLPGKVLMRLNKVPILQIIIEKILISNKIADVIVATTDNAKDIELINFLSENMPSVKCFVGSESDVLDRFYHASKSQNPDYIVRITADDPLKDPNIIDKAIDIVIEDPSLDYCSNTLIPTYPEGLDVEVFKFTALEKAWKNSNKKSEREHVTPYIWSNPNLFKLKNFTSNSDCSFFRWTLDTFDDYMFFSKIFEKFPNHKLHDSNEIITYLNEHPEILSINSGVLRNAGYLKSIQGELNEK